MTIAWNRAPMPGAALPLILLLASCVQAVDGSADTGDVLNPESSTSRAVNDRRFLEVAIPMLAQAEDRVHVIQFVIYRQGVVDDLLQAMADAAARGVDVKLLADETAADTVEAVGWLTDRGVDARLDSPATTTHNKLLVVDDATLVGSHNFTTSAMNWNHEASVLVTEPEATAFYEAYFQALWSDSDRDPQLQAPSLPDLLPLANRDILSGLDQCIGGATEAIDVVMYAMSWSDSYPDSDVNRLVEALVDKRRQGIEVRVILDSSDWIVDNGINDAALQELLSGGVEVRLAPSSTTTHAKVVVCDDMAVVGDANWSYSSFHLYNGTSVMVRAADVVGDYRSWIGDIWQASRPASMASP